ncbi:MAG: hypothetical protein M1434_11560 [Chloroflexi bacterium]|nr:hypothetical protein [Chloroflexota bacterium]MCL5275359.1 hypothetical protein [Chloroflexota bacterium]
MTNRTWQKLDSPAVIFSLGRCGREGWLLGANEGLWRYHDGACTIVSEALRAAAITAVAAPDRYPYQNLLLVGSVDGIARSIDGGQTWNSATLAQPSQVSQIVLSPGFEFDGIAFAATLEDGVLRTSDEGQRWSSWNFGLLDLETLALAVSPNFAADETVFVATASGVFRSTNGGRAWRELAFAGDGPEADDALPPTGVAVIDDTIVVSSESKGLFYSRDNGDTWFKRVAFRSGQTYTLSSSYDGTRLLLATPSTIAISPDSGATWERLGRAPDSVIAIAIDDDGSVLCGTQDDGLWVYR